MKFTGIDGRVTRRVGTSRRVGRLPQAGRMLSLALLASVGLTLRLDAPPGAWGHRVSGGAAPAGPSAPEPPQAAVPSAATAVLARFHIREDVVHLSPAAQVLAIIGETLISEDLTCVTVGTLIHEKKIPWLRGGVACFLGIYIGDLTFFFLGRRAGGRLLKFRFFSRALGEQRLREFGEWFDRKPWAAIMACRFLPGIRVPLYVSVGAMTKRTAAFFWWTCFFACVWTPALVGLVVLAGDAVTKPLQYVFGNGWWTIPLTIVVLFALVKVVITVSTAEGRQKIKGWFSRSPRASPGTDSAGRGGPGTSEAARVGSPGLTDPKDEPT